MRRFCNQVVPVLDYNHYLKFKIARDTKECSIRDALSEAFGDGASKVTKDIVGESLPLCSIQSNSTPYQSSLPA
jgi:hypothetical protein